MSKNPTIDHWERGQMFGVEVIRGYIKGERRIARFKASVYAGCWVDAAEGDAFWRFGVPRPDEPFAMPWRTHTPLAPSPRARV